LKDNGKCQLRDPKPRASLEGIIFKWRGLLGHRSGDSETPMEGDWSLVV